MRPFIVYDGTTGEIVGKGYETPVFIDGVEQPSEQSGEEGTEVLEEELLDNESFVDVADNNTVKTKLTSTAGVDKPSVLADGADEVTFTGMTPGDQVPMSIGGEVVDAFPWNSGANSSVTFDVAGEYTIHFLSVKHLPGEATVNAT